MADAATLRKAMLAAHGESRVKLAKLYRIAVARERVQQCHLASDTLWSSRGDLEALAGIRSHPLHPSPGWERFRRDGAIVVDSGVLGERVVVVESSSTPVPPGYETLAVWTLAELRRCRDALRGGQFRFEIFESINNAKRDLGGVVLSASSPALQGEVTDVASLPVESGACQSPHRSKRCTARIAAGEISCRLTLDAFPDDYVLVCMPCGVQYPWTSPALAARRRWAKTNGVQL